MKLLLCFSVLCLGAIISAHDAEFHILKRWAIQKAIAGCVGEEVYRQYLVNIKTANAKCRQQPVPEIDLPMFKSNFKTAGALVEAAYDRQESKDKYLRRFIVRKAFENLMEDEDLYDSDSDRLFNRKSGRRGNRPFNRDFPRFRRESETSEGESDLTALKLELGHQLSQKISIQQQNLQAEVGNRTCVLRELGLLDSSNNFNSIENIIDRFNGYAIEDEWLQDNLERDIRLCYEFADNIPEEIHSECIIGAEVSKVKFFKKCMKKRKLRTCLFYDVRQQLQDNFAPVEDLVAQTDVEERRLLPLVYKLLHEDDESDNKFF